MTATDQANDQYLPAARRAGDLVFLGTHTPHDRTTGRLVVSTADLGQPLATDLRAKVLFTEVAFGPVKAQTRKVLENLKASLEAAGSSIEHLAHLRIFVTDIGMEGVVLGVVRTFFGTNLPSGELIEAANQGVDPKLHVHMDGVAMTVDAGRPTHLRYAGLEKLTEPFPAATKAGPFLFSSQFGGIDPATGAVVDSLSQLSVQTRPRIDPLLAVASKHNRPFLLQQGALWDNILKVLQASNVSPNAILYHMNWMRPTMRVFSDGSITRSILDLTGDYLLTCFPTSNLRDPLAQLDGRVIAVLPESGLKKSTKVPIHGISNSYFGMIAAGPYLFGSGEVPVDTDRWALVDEMHKLPSTRRTERFGKVYREPPIQSQAHYVYELWHETLAAYGATFDMAVHQSAYLACADDGPAFDLVVREHFPKRAPATTVVPIIGASPFAQTRLELELTAYRPASV